MADVVVYSRVGCGLCQRAEALVRSLAGPSDVVRVVDVDTDPDLHRRYTVRVPVVSVDGREVAELHITADDLAGVLPGPS